MKRTLWRLCLSCIAGVGVIGVAVPLLTHALADGKLPPKQPNVQPAANVPRADRPKSKIEMPAKRILASQTAPSPVAAASAFVNPKVQPGKVHWHKDFAAACRAAQKSGKPVLLFQMMGKLDDQFC